MSAVVERLQARLAAVSATTPYGFAPNLPVDDVQAILDGAVVLDRIGITATRKGLTEPQALAVRNLLTHRRRVGRALAFHHGDCLGGDVETAEIADDIGLFTVAHPPIVDRFRARHESDEVRPVADYHARNAAIVDEVDELIACPDGPERSRSGTWWTVQYARRVDRCRTVIAPDGSIIEQVFT